MTEPDTLYRMAGAMLDAGWSYKQIEQAFTALQRDGLAIQPPAGRTVRWWVAEGKVKTTPRPDAPWTLATDETGRPRSVVRVLAAVQQVSGGRISHVTQADARWIARLAAALPRLERDEPLPPDLANPFGTPSVTLYVLAQMFRAAESRKDDAELAKLTAQAAASYSKED